MARKVVRYELTPEGVRKITGVDPFLGSDSCDIDWDTPSKNWIGVPSTVKPSPASPVRGVYDQQPISQCRGGIHIFVEPLGEGLLIGCPASRIKYIRERVDLIIGSKLVVDSRFGLKPDVFGIEWPDMGVPDTLPASFWRDITEQIIAGKSVVFCCQGGHGRTGTALAAVLGIAHKLSAAEAIERVRSAYCPDAVESANQEEYLEFLLDGAEPPAYRKWAAAIGSNTIAGGGRRD